MQIVRDYPMGVGAGKFFQVIGRYVPEHAEADPCNTYLRCAAELGILGFVLLMLLFLNAFRILRQCQLAIQGLPEEHDFRFVIVGLQACFVAFAVSGTFISMTYIEELFVFLLLPVCVQRAVSFRERILAAEPFSANDMHDSLAHGALG